MRHRVVHQVADDLAQADLIAQYQRRVGGADGEADLPVRSDDPRVVHRVGGDGEHVNRAELQRPLLVEPGEQQQVVDEHAHALGFLLHALDEVVEIASAQAARWLVASEGIV